MLVFRSEPVVEKLNRGMARDRDLGGQTTVGPRRPDDVGTAVEIEDGAAGIGIRGLEAIARPTAERAVGDRDTGRDLGDPGRDFGQGAMRGDRDPWTWLERCRRRVTSLATGRGRYRFTGKGE